MMRDEGRSDRRARDDCRTAVEQLVDALRESIDADGDDATRVRGIIERLERPGRSLDAKEFITIYGDIDLARDAAWRATPWSFDSPERARWRLVIALSKACLMRLTQEWRRTRSSRATAARATKIWPASMP